MLTILIIFTSRYEMGLFIKQLWRKKNPQDIFGKRSWLYFAYKKSRQSCRQVGLFVTMFHVRLEGEWVHGEPVGAVIGTNREMRPACTGKGSWKKPGSPSWHKLPARKHNLVLRESKRIKILEVLVTLLNTTWIKKWKQKCCTLWVSNLALYLP